jgi:hypothetical protein
VVLAAAAALGAGGAGYAWTTDSGYYALLPDPAHEAAKVVHAQGGKPPAKGTGIYFVDVSILRANEVQKLWAEHVVEGAELVPYDHILSTVL